MQRGRILENGCTDRHAHTRFGPLSAGSVSIVARDLNQPMLDHASSQLPPTRVTWVVCQFGVMFFPDKLRAFFRSLSRAETKWTLPVQCLGSH
jgi:hypothetical protein